MNRLRQSVGRVGALLSSADLADDSVVADLLAETWSRRTLDLSDLSPAEQAELVAGRAQQLQPTAEALAERITEAGAHGRPFVAKLGIDPTGAEVHLGHVVPMLVLSRFQRMGHQAVLIVGDMTAKIGDPSGRSDERPPLGDEEIAANLATYRHQVAPFFDFERAQLRHNGDWLRQVTLPDIIAVTSRIPVSMPLQREDFRRRLEAGHGLSLSELLYSVVMALDSVEIGCDVEIGGIDQFLNMQMCRKVMEICGQVPEVVVATALIEGTDGTGAKMSKSQGNYIPLTADADEMFGKVMSVPDRLVAPYFRALSEWSDAELTAVDQRLAEATAHPMDVKKLLAGEVTAAVHGVHAAMAARAQFVARFSRRSFVDLDHVPVVADLDATVVEVLHALGFTRTSSEARRIAAQNGLRLVVELDGAQDQLPLSVEEALAPLGAVLQDRIQGRRGQIFLKCGRQLARITAP